MLLSVWERPQGLTSTVRIQVNDHEARFKPSFNAKFKMLVFSLVALRVIQWLLRDFHYNGLSNISWVIAVASAVVIYCGLYAAVMGCIRKYHRTNAKFERVNANFRPEMDYYERRELHRG